MTATLETAPLLAKFARWAADEGLMPVPAPESPVDAYYDASRKEFALRNERGRWLSHSATQFAMLLRHDGIATKERPAEVIIAELINTRDVSYVGSLAGRPAGFYEANGIRMLVTEGPRVPEARAGEWPALRGLLDGLLGADREYGGIQLQTFFCWMRSAYEAVARGKWRPGHVLALAGPRNCGKSLLQRLITECLGGRAADAFRYLNGATEFNRELFGAEHLFVDDAQASTDFRTRMQMAAHLKALSVGRDHQCHGKGREAVNLRPVWRCTLSLNDEGECLLVLPPLRTDIADKIHIFRCSAPAEPFPTRDMDGMEGYWNQLVSELPAFLEHCGRAEPPPGCHDTRFGFAAFHHPALVAELESQAPEVVLLELLDLELWRDVTVTEWEGTARDLEAVLVDPSSKVRDQARRLLGWASACGTYLSRLALNQPDRVAMDRSAQRRSWIIRKPRKMTP